jgi:nicotinate-nucleotide--dimethylbenzimidazole phosphoribosyltransferase
MEMICAVGFKNLRSEGYMLADLTIHISNPSRTAEIQQLIQAKSMHFDLPTHLRDTGAKIALVQDRDKPFLAQPIIYTFFGDHGIVEAGLCKRSHKAGSDVVRQYISGNSALNIFSRQNRIELRLVDCGLEEELKDPKIIQRKIGKGTRNFAQDQAMSSLQLERCIKNGREIIRTRRNQASNTVGIGIQSVGSELACIMLLARLRSLPLETLLAQHPAFSQADMVWILKKLRAILNSSGPVKGPLDELQNFGGFEMATALGAILQACQQRCIVLVDGLVGSCLAWLASLLFPECASYIIIAQSTQGFADTFLAKELGTEALTYFDTLICDGSGIALNFPMVQAACSFLNESTAHRLQSGA